jgi:hypothetical protein
MVANETVIVIKLNENECDFPELRGITSESCHKASKIEIWSPKAGDIYRAFHDVLRDYKHL